MNIVPLRAFSDNYIWLLQHGRYAAVVDPGDAHPVLDYLRQHQLRLCAIFITHHHRDHMGGVEDLLKRQQPKVYAPHDEYYAFPHHAVSEGDPIEIAELQSSMIVLDVPGHTAGHVAYYGGNRLFCGDTLFGCGCGRIFDGTVEQLYSSLQKIAGLPDLTRIYPAHEYTLANIRFARMLDPENRDLAEREIVDRRKLEQGQPTLPSTILMEKKTNPFLRSYTRPIRQALEKMNKGTMLNDKSTFAMLRELKNNY